MTDLQAHHYAVTVADLDRALEFYRDVLGLDVVDEFSLSDESFATAVGVDGATGSFVHLDADGVRVELIEYDPEGAAVDDQSVNQAGATHLGLSVSDVDAFYDGLPEDVETLSPPQTTDSGARILFVRDPEGTLVELLEP
ncbi:VOC family protein [Candidatus Halobonum tyrrellensis]|uniref:Glyoxalase/bleomycin resistance protein/dioxygenase n=1 Tax=Candidatus Halobonum tyrrellensis G22 TaxID=1324957 RepID=V4HGT9_9EURY|nr:VOC family protein [Candidatus Halobonum tyrrellensis]ESP87039.1 Glyoxalase/bleomycin resistance protein/dioxygenase [Candidatus Halobonum tyrrellensis G22]